MNDMPKDSSSKKDARMELRIPGATMDKLIEIHERHGISPQDVARRCLEQVTAFYMENGFFSFPVHLEPEASFLHRARTYKSAIEASDAALEPIAKTPKTRKTA
jgi:hypothetical protein